MSAHLLRTLAQTAEEARARGDEARQHSTPQTYIIDERGRRLRATFPLYDRVAFTANVSVLPSMASAPRALSNVGPSFAWHESLALDYDDEEIWWMLRHTVLETRYLGDMRGTGRLRSTLLRAQYLRHDLNSFIVVPRLRGDDLRLPANFDIAADYHLLSVDLLEVTPLAPTRGLQLDKIDTVRAALMMDLVRDGSYGKRFAFGIAGGHVMRRGEDLWRHEVSPLTSLKLIYGLDHRQGRARIYGEITCGGAVSLNAPQDAPPWMWRCQTRHEAEWLFMTISDHPISLPVEVRADIPLAGASERVIEASVGVRIGLMTQAR